MALASSWGAFSPLSGLGAFPLQLERPSPLRHASRPFLQYVSLSLSVPLPTAGLYGDSAWLKALLSAWLSAMPHFWLFNWYSLEPILHLGRRMHLTLGLVRSSTVLHSSRLVRPA